MRTSVQILLFTTIILLFAVTSCELTDEPVNEDDRERFLGDWNCQEYLEGQPQISYTVTIKADPTDSSRIILENFAYIGFNEPPPYGIVDGPYVNVPTQKVCFDQSITIGGSGQSVSKNEQQWEYTVEIGGDSFHYTALFRRIN